MNSGPRHTLAVLAALWFAPDYDLSKRHYYGPGDTWWGADMAIVPLGAGRCIVSQLRLVENLGKDPVADKILYNLMEWTTAGAPATERAGLRSGGREVKQAASAR